jgi:glycosyltransferase involved in cell wall biosynthesis
VKVALVHDYLVNRGGAEKVALALHRIFPDAPLYTSIYHPEATFAEFREADVRTTALQRLSKDPEDFRRLLPLFARAFRKLALDGFDLVISSSTGFAHHVRPTTGCHIVYCHNPPRFLWDPLYGGAELAPRWARPAVPSVLAYLRRRDRRAGRHPHSYIANSAGTAARIHEAYGRRSIVVPPPIEVGRFAIGPRTGDYHVMVGRLVAYRAQELAVRAFTAMARRLVVVGDGPARPALEAVAGPTIEFVGAVDDARVAALYASCRGVIVPGVEDFGIVPLEANASGRPVIARAAGGVLETVRDGEHGILFREPTEAGLIAAVERAERTVFDPVVLRAHAETFSEAAFAARIVDIVGQIGSCLRCAQRAA